MDIKPDLSVDSTNIMAASLAPTIAATNAFTTATTTSSTTCSSSSPSTTNTTTLAATTTSDTPALTIDNYNNFHELCRSCGKTNAELYDLFQTTNCWNTNLLTSATSTTLAATAAVASPFDTSSTTCYTHLNTSNTTTKSSINCGLKSSLSSTSSPSAAPSTSSSTAAMTTTTTATPLSSSSLSKGTFDSVAATAKATAKGQSNMENILQDMQIWHLQIKCNDGLPQRICAKCTAQFYMIHKFRRKCLKVQTQLRALYEEQQQKLQLVVNERQEKDSITIESATSTPTPHPPPPPPPSTIEETTAATTLKVEVKKPPETQNDDHDLKNDSHGEQALSSTTLLSSSSTSSTTSSSVNFKTNTWNANDDDATLLDKVVKTMAKPEATKPTPLVKKPAERYVKIQENQWSKVKKDAPPPSMVLNTKMPPFSLNKPQLKQKHICDIIEQQQQQQQDEEEQEEEEQQEENKTKKLRFEDQEELLATHVIFKTKATNNNNKQQLRKQIKNNNQKQDLQMDTDCQKVVAKEKEFLKLSHIKPTKECVEGLFITKAALKAYNVNQTVYDNSRYTGDGNSSIPSLSSSSNTSLFGTCENQDYYTIKQQQAVTSSSPNDNNSNNDHDDDHDHEHNKKPQQTNDKSLPQESETEYDSKTTNSNSFTTSPASITSSSSKLSQFHIKLGKTEASLNNLPKRRSTLHRVNRKAWHKHNKQQRGHRYKLNAKLLNSRQQLKKQRALLQHTSSHRKKQRSQQHELKCRPATNIRTCTSTLKTRYTNKQQEQENNNEKEENPSKILTMEDEETSSKSPSSSLTSSSSLLSPKAKNINVMKQQQSVLTGSSSSTAAPATIMWKTKAAMKANSNDMHMDNMMIDKQQHHRRQKDFKYTSKKPILLQYRTSSSPSPTRATTATFSRKLYTTIEKRPKTTHNENQMDCNIIKEKNTLLSSQDREHNDNKAKQQCQEDEKKEVEELLEEENKKHKLNSLWPEEAVQKQINPNNEDGELEKIKENPSPKPTATQPGSMKLILQRKRGKRFRIRRQEEEEDAILDNTKLPKRRKTLASNNNNNKVEMESLFSLDFNGEYTKEDEELIYANEDPLKNLDDLTVDSDILEIIKENNIQIIGNIKENSKNNTENVSLFNNPQNTDYISDMEEYKDPENSLDYRDSCINKAEIIDEDKEDLNQTFKLNEESTNHFELKSFKELDKLETTKKLIIRVPLTSLTQNFMRLHLSLEKKEAEKEIDEELSDEKQEIPLDFLANPKEVEEVLNCNDDLNKLDISGSSQSDLLGFSQSSEASSSAITIDSTQKSIEVLRGTNSDANSICTASSKINEFINDFQNNCIDSSEIEEPNGIIPKLPPSSQELSDEIRDVEDTLNGILSEMHDKDMYTPRSTGEHEDFFAHSVYSPLTDAPTTPSRSFYAESPCTVNSNPMSVSPFIQPNMDYNAMTPQSNHSSMGHSSHMGSSSSGHGSVSSCGGSNTNPNVFRDQYPPYNECFAEESTQSELIAFQNDIPCFENIEVINPPTPSGGIASNDPAAPQEIQNEEESSSLPLKNSIHTNSALQGALPKPDIKSNDIIEVYEDQESTEQQYTTTEPLETDLHNQTPELVPNIQHFQQNQYHQPSYHHLQQNPHSIMQSANNNALITSTPHSHYIVTNTARGPLLIANPNVNTGQEQLDNAFKAHANGLQFVTLGQALEANKNHQHSSNGRIINNPMQPEINWTTSQANTNTNAFTPQSGNTGGTTTYFFNAGGEVYRASIPTPSPSLNTLIVPPVAAQQHQQQQQQQHIQHQTVAFNKPAIDANENYIQALQQHAQQHPSRQTSQYIMVVNNLGTTPHYYATTAPAQLTQTSAAAAPPTNLQQQPQTLLIRQTHVQNPQTYLNQQQKQLNLDLQRPTPTNTPVALTSLSPPLKNAQDSQKSQKSPNQTMHQRINQQLQQQIKQRQMQLIQPRSPNCTQKINLICRFCHKRPKFTNNVDYSNHIINTHPAEKPYNCPHCPMHFQRRFERQHHVAQAHGSRYQCAQCGLSFCAQRALDFHLQKYHANLGRSQQKAATASATASSSSSSVNQQQQNSTSSTSSSSATYQLLQQNQQQRLVRVEDVHVQVTGESKNKRPIDLELDGGSDMSASQPLNEDENLSESITEQQQQTLKLCCPDCDDDNDDCCSSKHHDHNNQPINQQQYTGNESVNQQHHHQQHVTIPSPEQTEPDSTTTLRHFRKRQLSEMCPFSSSTSSSTSSSNNCHDNAAIAGDCGDDGGNAGGGEQIAVERALRGSHNCLFCEESFTNEIALRKHHHLAHGTQATMPFVCNVCKRGFRIRNALQRHMETHDAEGRPYECNICQVRFPRPSQLTLHKLTVHKFEKPHSCEECGKQFGTESAMKAHAKTHEDAETTKSPQLSSCMYVDTATTTSTTNEQNVNLQSTTSGEIATTTESSSSPNNDDDLNTNNDDYNTSQNQHNNVSGLTS